MSEFKFPAALTEGGSVTTVTAFNPGAANPIYTADSRHPHWNGILKGLREGDNNVWSLFDVAAGIMASFQQVTDRVSFDGKNVLFDGEPVHSALTHQLQRALENGHADDYVALARFWEKLESNPNEHSREQAYDWLASHEFQITQHGDIVGYKYVFESREEEGVYLSGHSSTVAGVPSGFVNGVPIKELSRIPQRIGDVVSMPRNEVVHDPTQACRRGLHVGTWNYVSNSGDAVMLVLVNPRDICSVPTDGRGEKVRVSRYVNDSIATTEPGTAPVLRTVEKSTRWVPDVSYRSH